MRTFLTLFLVIGLAFSGIYLYATAQPHDFDQIRVGSDKASVVARMGDPQELNNLGFYNRTVEELHYYRWPIPTVYVIEIMNEKVVAKHVLQSP